MAPASQSKFLTIRPPGKSLNGYFTLKCPSRLGLLLPYNAIEQSNLLKIQLDLLLLFILKEHPPLS